jgi:hypothetical protein
LWTQNSSGIDDLSESEDRFGAALLAANLNGESHADLAVGVTGESVGQASRAGAVQVIYGSTNGLSATGDQFWTQDSAGISGVAETSDKFGAALAAGNFGDSAEKDLAIGAPLEDAGGKNDGAVNVIYGSPSGLTATGNQQFHSDTGGFPGDADDDDNLGTALAAADFGHGTYADLAIGVPLNSLGATHAGAVVVLYGTSSGLSTAQSQYWTQDSMAIIGVSEVEDRFGRSLAVGNYGRTALADLAIGAPWETYEHGFSDEVDCGAVNVLYGSDSGLGPAGNQFWWQASDTLQGSAEDLDDFATALA